MISPKSTGGAKPPNARSQEPWRYRRAMIQIARND